MLAAGEIALGLLLLRGSGWAKLEWAGVIAFHLALMIFGWGIWLWSVPAGLRTAGEADVLPVRDAASANLDGIDLLVVGGPTHAWGMTRVNTREQAVFDGRRKGMRVEARPGDLGLREWLSALTGDGLASAAFDTRIKAPAAVTGRASRGIMLRLRRNGFSVLAPEASFFVTRDNHLVAGEADRARQWGRDLAEKASHRSRSAEQA